MYMYRIVFGMCCFLLVNVGLAQNGFERCKKDNKRLIRKNNRLWDDNKVLAARIDNLEADNRALRARLEALGELGSVPPPTSFRPSTSNNNSNSNKPRPNSNSLADKEKNGGFTS